MDSLSPSRRRSLQWLAAGALVAATRPLVAKSGCYKAKVSPLTRLTLSFGPETGALVPGVDSNGPTAIDGESSLWFLQAIGGTIKSTPWSIHKGATMDDLQRQYDFVPDAHWERPHHDDTWWPEGFWIDPATGTWFVVMHQEYNYNKYQKNPGTGYSIDRFVTISLATSTDQGRSWTHLGEIIGSDHPDDPAYWGDKDYRDGGQGDPSLYVDDQYFYVYYNARWLNRGDLDDIYSGVRVARCRVVDKMMPGKWQKFYLGQWNQPGLGGHDSDVFNDHYSDTATVFWSKNRQLYFAVTLSDQKLIPASREWDYRGFISTCTDLNLQNWTKSIQLCERQLKGYYTWVIDPQTRSRYVMESDRFHWYGYEFSKLKQNRAHWVSIAPAPAVPKTLAPLYPPVSVDDYTPGWDSNRFPPCPLKSTT